MPPSIMHTLPQQTKSRMDPPIEARVQGWDRNFGKHHSLFGQDKVSALCRRVEELKELNSAQRMMRGTIRAIMNGGSEAVAHLLGESMSDKYSVMPVANYMVMAAQRMGQKIGQVPPVNVDPPVNRDSDRARHRAEKKERIVKSFDDSARMQMQAPQLGMWLPGYGFTPFVVSIGRDANNDPYPKAQIRDPYEALPSEWSVDQQPEDIAFHRRIPVKKLKEMFPEHKDRLQALSYESGFRYTTGGRYIDLAEYAPTGTWSNQGGTSSSAIDVYEYINEEGTWWILPRLEYLLLHVPNPLKNRPPFYVAKRFSFDRLTGQYDHIIGLMGAIARLNLLLIISIEDNVNAETNIIGDVMGGSYKRGRKAVNKLTPGSSVDKSNFRVPFETFQQAGRLETQLRDIASYPMTDDARSPSSWTTGQGLRELQTSIDSEVRQYFTVTEDLFKNLDAMRFEFAERVHANRELSIQGLHKKAPYRETYIPSRDIQGDYYTRREFGAFAELDDMGQIVAHLNLQSAEIIDSVTVRENVPRLNNITQIESRIEWQKAKDTLHQMVLAMANGEMPDPDPRVVMFLMDSLPEGQMKKRFQEIFKPEEKLEQMEQQEQQALQDPMAAMMGAMGGGGQGQLPGGPGGGAVPPDAQQVLQRLTMGGGGDVEPTMGVQTT